MFLVLLQLVSTRGSSNTTCHFIMTDFAVDRFAAFGVTCHVSSYVSHTIAKYGSSINPYHEKRKTNLMELQEYECLS